MTGEEGFKEVSDQTFRCVTQKIGFMQHVRESGSLGVVLCCVWVVQEIGTVGTVGREALSIGRAQGSLPDCGATVEPASYESLRTGRVRVQRG